MRYSFVVPGPPVGKERPRVEEGRDGRKHTRTPTRTKAYEALVQIYARRARVKPLEGPLKMTLVWARQVSASWSKKRKAEALAGVYATGMPDLDNVAKSISDALNGVAYADDAQIAVLAVSRIYVESESSVRVEIETLE